MTLTNHIDSSAESSMTIPDTKINQDEKYENNGSAEEENPFLNNQKIITPMPDEFKSINCVTREALKEKRHNDVENLKLKNDERTPPDGGTRAWMIMVASFLINGILFGVINCFSMMYGPLVDKLTAVGETGVNPKVSLVGSLGIGTTFLLSPIAGILTDWIGIRKTTFIGGALAFGGMLFSSISTHNVKILYLTYGVMYGLGASLAYTPSLVILGHYFKRRLGLVNGIVTAGSSTFTIIMPFLMDAFLKQFGLEGTLRSLAILTSVIMLCAILFKPIHVNEKATENFIQKLKKGINTSIWRKKRYVVWACVIPFSLFGYFVPYVHIINFVVNAFGNSDKIDLRQPIMCMGITSGIGRLVFGYIADRPRVNRILLQQLSFFSIGLLTMLLPITPPYYIILLFIILFMGLFDGCFISLLGPIAFDICGRQGASQAIGCLLGLCAFPLIIGPVIAGYIFEIAGSYTLPLLLAGVPPIIGSIVMFLIRRVKDDSAEIGEKADESTGNCVNGLDSALKRRQEEGKELEIFPTNGTKTLSE